MPLLHSRQRNTRGFLTACAVIAVMTGCQVARNEPPATVMNYGTAIPAPHGVAVVQAGDTLWKISQRYRLPLRDLIDVNDISPPYALKRGQRIALPAPREHRVGANDTLHSLSRMYGVPVSGLVKLNKVPAPYHINVGQVIRLPSQSTAHDVMVATGQTRREEPRTVSGSVAATPPATRAPVAVVQNDKAAVKTPPTSTPRKTTAPASKEKSVLAAARPAPGRIVTTLPSAKRRDFVWPVRGKVISTYGAKSGQLFNDGVNIAVPRGTPVAAAADGVVAYVGDDLSTYGNLVLIRHGSGVMTAYAHMAAVTVTRGQSVKKGEMIGAVGSTGKVANSQLHFEIRQGTKTIDPQKFLG